MRRRFTFTGRVQGVGFRATAHDIASRHPITGWVRNEPSGAVTLEAQGSQPALDRFLSDLSAAMKRNISAITTTDLPDLPTESSFDIHR